MKIDLGLLFYTLSILLVFYNWVVPSEPIISKLSKKKKNSMSQSKKPSEDILLIIKNNLRPRIPQVLKENQLLMLMGFLTGFAFGIKLTILFFFLALLAAIWYSKGGMLGLWSAFFLIFGFTFLLHLDEQPKLRQFHTSVDLLQWVLLAVGLGILSYFFFKRKETVRELMISSLILVFSFILPVLPWLGKNISETNQFTVEAVLNGKKATPKMNLNAITKQLKELGITEASEKKEDFFISGLYGKPEENASESNSKIKSSNKFEATQVDLHRFMGYELLLTRYLSLPYDTFLQTNVQGVFVDGGFVILLLLPIVFLFLKRKEPQAKVGWSNLVFAFACILMLIISIPSAFLNRNNLDSPSEGIALLSGKNAAGFLNNLSNELNLVLVKIYSPIYDLFSSISGEQDAVTYPILMLLFISLILLLQYQLRFFSKITQAVIFFLTIYFFLWWLLSSGAAWYGMLLFCLPFIFIVRSIGGSLNQINKKNLSPLFRKAGMFILVGLGWLVMAFSYRSNNYNPVNEKWKKYIYYPQFTEYQIGNKDQDWVLDYFFPSATRVGKILNQNEQALVYRVGTQINFFIDNNDRRVIDDTFLNSFKEMVNRFQDKQKIIQAIKQRGVEYLVFDLGIPSSDQTPGKEWTKNYINLVNTLFNNPGVELVFTDRTIKITESGSIVNGVFPYNGDIQYFGKIAVFKIK